MDFGPKISYQECLTSLVNVRTFCQQRDVPESVHESLKKIEKLCLAEVAEAATVQKNITDFFN